MSKKVKEKKTETLADKNAKKALPSFLAVKENVCKAVSQEKDIAEQAKTAIAKVRADRTKSIANIDNVLNRNDKYKKAMAIVKKYIKNIDDLNALRHLYYDYVDYDNLPKAKRQAETVRINNLRRRLDIKASIRRKDNEDNDKLKVSLACNKAVKTPSDRLEVAKLVLQKLATKFNATIPQTVGILKLAEAEVEQTA